MNIFWTITSERDRVGDDHIMNSKDGHAKSSYSNQLVYLFYLHHAAVTFWICTSSIFEFCQLSLSLNHNLFFNYDFDSLNGFWYTDLSWWRCLLTSAWYWHCIRKLSSANILSGSYEVVHASTTIWRNKQVPISAFTID